MANYQAALRAVKYQNTSDNPCGSTRTVSFTVNDGTADIQRRYAQHHRSASSTTPPSLSGIETSALAYTENDPATAITATLAAADADNTEPGQRHGPDHRQLPERPGCALVHQHGQHHRRVERRHRHVDPERQRHGGQLPGGPRAVKYQDTSDNPSTATRTVSFTVNDGGANSNTVTRNITVTAVDDPPVLSGIETSALAYTENAAGHGHHLGDCGRRRR